MSSYLEVWLRDSVKDQFRDLSPEDSGDYHPHITIIRPFTPKGEEGVVKDVIVGYCQGKIPIPFRLEGKDKFGSLNYVPVVNSKELLQFNNELEQLLEPHVNFVEKLDGTKKLHVTIGIGEDISPFPPIDLFMLRLTGIRNKKIWFSFDFVTQQVLSREESLNKERWNQTVQQFTNK